MANHSLEDRPRPYLGGISCIPRRLVRKNESHLRTTLRSVQLFIFSAYARPAVCKNLYPTGVLVTLLNIHESQRFKKGAFRFWGAFLCTRQRRQRMQAQPLRRHAREALKFTRLAFTLFWRQSASCVPRRRINLPTARCISERPAWPSLWETSRLMTSILPGKARDVECVQRPMIGWQIPTRFGRCSTGGHASVLYTAMPSLASTTMGASYMARGR